LFGKFAVVPLSRSLGAYVPRKLLSFNSTRATSEDGQGCKHLTVQNQLNEVNTQFYTQSGKCKSQSSVSNC